jgi:predicted nuclease of predicted toxin-antitoxin system
MLKFLADVNIENDLVDFLKKQGYDVLWIPDYDCRLKDDELLELANDSDRILITNDTDFGELVFLQRKISTGIILIRVKEQDIHKKLRALKKLLKFHSNKIKHSFIVISDRRIRIRSLENL